MVDEDISRRTIALSIRTGKLTARTLAWALRAAGRKIQKGVRNTPHGRQTVRQLMKQGEATNFGEYSRRVMDRSRARRAPILERMKRAGELLRSQERTQERKKEAAREER